MSYKVEKDGTITLTPHGEEVLQCFQDIKSVIKNYDNTDALYCLTYSMISLAFGQMKMDGKILENFLNLITDHLAAEILGENQ